MCKETKHRRRSVRLQRSSCSIAPPPRPSLTGAPCASVDALAGPGPSPALLALPGPRRGRLEGLGLPRYALQGVILQRPQPLPQHDRGQDRLPNGNACERARYQGGGVSRLKGTMSTGFRFVSGTRMYGTGWSVRLCGIDSHPSRVPCTPRPEPPAAGPRRCSGVGGGRAGRLAQGRWRGGGSRRLP